MSSEPLQSPDQKTKGLLDNSRAFPYCFDGMNFKLIANGLSKREHYASLILSAIISHSGIAAVNQEVIDQAIRGAGQFLDAIEDSTEE